MKPTIEELAKSIDLQEAWATPSDPDMKGRFGFEKLPDSSKGGVKEYEPFLKKLMKIKEDEEWPRWDEWRNWDGPNPYIELTKEFKLSPSATDFIIRRVMDLPVDNNFSEVFKAWVKAGEIEKELGGPYSETPAEKRRTDIEKYIKHLMNIYGMKSEDDPWPEPQKSKPTEVDKYGQAVDPEERKQILNPISELIDKFGLDEDEAKAVVTSVMDDDLFNAWVKDLENKKRENKKRQAGPAGEAMFHGQPEVAALAKSLGISNAEAMDMVNKKMDELDIPKVQAIDLLSGKTAKTQKKAEEAKSSRRTRFQGIVSKIRTLRNDIANALEKHKTKSIEKAAKKAKINFAKWGGLVPTSYPQPIPGITNPNEEDPPMIYLGDEIIEVYPEVLDQNKSFIGMLAVWAAAGYKVKTGDEGYDKYFADITKSGQLPADF